MNAGRGFDDAWDAYTGITGAAGSDAPIESGRTPPNLEDTSQPVSYQKDDGIAYITLILDMIAVHAHVHRGEPLDDVIKKTETGDSYNVKFVE